MGHVGLLDSTYFRQRNVSLCFHYPQAGLFWLQRYLKNVLYSLPLLPTRL